MTDDDNNEADSELERRVLPDIPSADIPSVDAPNVDTDDKIENPEDELVPEPGSQMNAGGSTVSDETRKQFAAAALLGNVTVLSGGIAILLLLFEGVTTGAAAALLIAVLAGLGSVVVYKRR